MNDEQDVARLIGQAFWRSEFIKSNPEATPDDVKAGLAADWRENRKDYTRTGLQVLRALARQGWSLSKDAASAEDDAAASEDVPAADAPAEPMNEERTD